MGVAELLRGIFSVNYLFNLQGPDAYLAISMTFWMIVKKEAAISLAD